MLSGEELIGRAREVWDMIDHEGLDWQSFANGWIQGRLDLAKEETTFKEAIQQAFYEGMLCQGFDPNMGRAEMYYNEVYKGNEELKDRKVWDALNEQWDLSKKK